MKFRYKEEDYNIIIEKKKTNKNTYIRVKQDLSIYVTTNYFTREKEIIKLIEENQTMKDFII